jgi:hypothetical protein
MPEDLASVLKHPAVKATLKTIRLVKRIQRAGDPYAVLDEVFKGAPEDIRRIAKSVLDVAHSVAQNPKQDPEEVARQIAVALGIPGEQVEDFIDTVVPLAEMLADTLKREEKLITSEETESNAEKQEPGLGEM